MQTPLEILLHPVSLSISVILLLLMAWKVFFPTVKNKNTLRILFVTIVVTVSQSSTAQNKFVEKSILLSTGVTLEYVEYGQNSKTPVLLLHGYTDSWRSFEHVITKFPNDYYVVAITQRGHGGSSKPSHKYQIKDFSDDAAAFLLQKGIKQCVVVGHSLGGLVAQQFAIDYPHHTRAIVLVSTDAFFVDNPGLPEFFSDVKKLSDPIGYDFAESFQRSTIFKPVDSAKVEVFVRESLKVPSATWIAIAEELLKVNLTNELGKIQVPTLILWGDRDSVCLWGDQQNLNLAIPKSTIKVYKETGHALHWEDGDQFVTDIGSFIESLK